jgi:hypothetical protein
MPEPLASPGSELVRYRRAGGMAGLDQRLTVYDDGRVVLEDHKARSRSEVQATDTEIANVHSLLEAVPQDAWHGLAATLLRNSLPRPAEGMRFELRRGSRRITGHAGRHDAPLAAVLAELDELLARAVRERRGSG